MSVPVPPTPELEALLTQVRGPVERFIARVVHNEWQREEALQETWMAILEKPQLALKANNPIAWALRIAYRKSVDELRHAGKSNGFSDVSQLSDGSERTEKMRELREWFLMAMERLRPDQRALLHLRYDQGMTSKEIAKVLGKRAGTVRRWLADAQHELGLALDRSASGHRVPWAVAFLPLLSGQAKSMEAAVIAAALPTASLPIGISLSSASGVLMMKKVAVLTAILIALSGLGWWAFEIASSSSGSPVKDLLSESGAQEVPRFTESQTRTRQGLEAEGTINTRTFVPTEALVIKLKGRVEDEEGHPVAGAQVFAMLRQLDAQPLSLDAVQVHSPEWMAKTNSDGSFVVERPRSDSSRRVIVAAQREDFAPAVRYDVILGGAEPLVLVLRRGRSLSGRIETLDGAPVASAIVKFRGVLGRGRWTRETQSNAAGVWQLRSLPHEETLLLSVQHLEVSHPEFAPQRRSVPAESWNQGVDRPAGKPIIVKLARGAVVKGRVLRAEDGVALSGADVVLWTFEDFMGARYARGMMFTNPFGSRIVARTKTNQLGDYQFRNVPVEVAGIKCMGTTRLRLPNGMISFGGVVACLDGYSQESGPVGLPTEEGSTQVIDLQLRPATSIRGRVIDQQGEPIAGVRVSAQLRSSTGTESRYPVPGEGGPYGSWAESDKQGQWRIDGLPVRLDNAKESVLKVVGCGCHVGLPKSNELSVAIKRGTVTEVPDLVLAVGRLNGLVKDAAGDPLCGAEVVVDQGLAVVTDIKGQWSRLLPVPTQTAGAMGTAPKSSSHLSVPSPATVTIQKEGYASVVERTSGADTLHVTTLLREKVLRGQILLDDGTPVANRHFTLRRIQSAQSSGFSVDYLPLGRQEAVTDGAGKFVLRGLADKACILAITLMRRESQFEVVPGGPDLVLRLPPFGALRAVEITLRCPDGSPFLGEATAQYELNRQKALNPDVTLPESSAPRIIGAAPFVMGKAVDKDGVLRIKHLKPSEGPVKVTLKPKGFPPLEIEDIELEAEVTRLEAIIDIGFTLKARVTLPPGVAGTTVSVTAQALSKGALRVRRSCTTAGEADLAGLTAGAWSLTARHHSVSGTWISPECKIVNVPTGYGSLPDERLKLTHGVTQFIKLKLKRSSDSVLRAEDPITVAIEDENGGIRRQQIVSYAKLLERYSTSIELPTNRGRLTLSGPQGLLLEFPFETRRAKLQGKL